MSPPNLLLARKRVLDKMVDQCLITRNEAGVADDVLDENTGALTSPTPTTVYNGVCSVKPQRHDAQVEGGRFITVVSYFAGIPWDAPMPKKGDVFKLTASANDSSLIDKEFLVADVESKSFLVQRVLRLEEVQLPANRPRP